MDERKPQQLRPDLRQRQNGMDRAGLDRRAGMPKSPTSLVLGDDDAAVLAHRLHAVGRVSVPAREHARDHAVAVHLGGGSEQRIRPRSARRGSWAR
jgi:hypothetical protein